MKRVIVSIAVLTLVISSIFAVVDYSNGSNTMSEAKAQQDVSLTLSGENAQSWFEVGFGSKGTPNSSPVVLTVNDTNATGSVDIYWDISTADAYQVQIKADKALDNSSAGGAESIAWAISATNFEATVPDVGDYDAKNVAGASQTEGTFKHNDGEATFYIATEALDAEDGYSGTYTGTITLSVSGS